MNVSSEEVMAGVLDKIIEDGDGDEGVLVQLTFRSLMIGPQGNTNTIAGHLKSGPVPFSYLLEVTGMNDQRQQVTMEMHFPASEVSRATRSIESGSIVRPPNNLKVS